MSNKTTSKVQTQAKTKAAGPRVALVLQGGGALGAYQAGVYHAMHENGFTPDWVVGTSIGAINAAIIAGNERDLRLSRLKEFWEQVGHGDLMDLSKVTDTARQFNTWWTTADVTMRGVPGFFSPRGPNPFQLGMAVAPEQASFYDTGPLAETLSRLVDFDFLNAPGGIRLTVSAMKVACGSLVKFDSLERQIGVEHIMASGALPPGFAPVRVDGDLYWDGGLYSNTPLEVVLEDEAKTEIDGHTICVLVDLWNANGPEPTTLNQIENRQKDVTFASRSERHIQNYLRMYQLRHAAFALYKKLPPELRSKSDLHEFKGMSDQGTIHVVRLRYGGHDWNMASKDINFSRGSIEWRWEQGYSDAMQTAESIRANGETFGNSDAGLVVHELVMPPSA
ncbi:patatin-like phospholipase family protein [Collimonas sp.]|jgi:NTE family protein|uniref:patatin-like phospholipase family protein n=1 Tax=Collimonas sp. TaxID=1963772 RepID=UPI002C8E656D|nr:patatin-like phospholipase family protein [Collimonas sp.]HWW06498.1 patatin-like phospholipase family protein [Collimonas sp.]